MIDKVQCSRTNDKFHSIDTIPIPGRIIRYARAMGHARIHRSSNNGGRHVRTRRIDRAVRRRTRPRAVYSLFTRRADL